MRSVAHRPDARASRALLLYEGAADRPDTGARDPIDAPGPYGDPYGDGYGDEYDPLYGTPRPGGLGWRARRSPFATQVTRNALTSRPDSLFHAEGAHVLVLGSHSPDGASRLRNAVERAHDLLFVHYTGALDTGDLFGRSHGRDGMPFLELFDAIERTPARHIVVVLEPEGPVEVPPAEALRPRHEELTRRFGGRLTLIVADPDPGASPRPFMSDALGADGPLSVRTLAAHPRAQVLMRARGRDVRLTGSGRHGSGPVLGHRARAVSRSLARTRPALTKAREATASALSAAVPPALVLLAVAAVAAGLFALLRALPPMRGTWGAAALLGLWAVLVVIGIVGARLRTPPARARPPGTASPVPRGRAFMDGMWAAWGFSGPVPHPAGHRPQPAAPPRPTREESRAEVERSLNAMYARLPVPQLRAPDPPAPSSPSPFPSPDDNGTTP